MPPTEEVSAAAGNNKTEIKAHNIRNTYQEEKNMDLRKIILLAMIEATFKDNVIDEETYHRMKQYVM